MAKITNNKLQKLKDYFDNDGSTDEDDIAAFLGVPIEELPAWQEAYDKFATPVPEIEYPSKSDADDLRNLAKEPEELRVVFREETGILRDLEVISRKGSTVFVQNKVAKDLVEIRLRGRDVTLDVIALRKLPAATIVEPHGLSAERLIQLAEAAR